MRIRFDVPADPAYAGRVAALMSGLYMRKYRLLGFGLVAVGLIGLALRLSSSDGTYSASPVFVAIIVIGVVSILFPEWMRFSSARRAAGLATDGSYDITGENVMMRSGTESHGIAWKGVTRVFETDEFWVLYVGRGVGTVIPRRLMAPDDERTLREFLVRRGNLPDAP